MTCHYQDLGSASAWLNQIFPTEQPTRSNIQIWVATRHQYGISGLVSPTSFGGETSGSVTKCRLSSQATVCSFKGVSTESAGEFLLYTEAVLLFSLLPLMYTPCAPDFQFYSNQ